MGRDVHGETRRWGGGKGERERESKRRHRPALPKHLPPGLLPTGSNYPQQHARNNHIKVQLQNSRDEMSRLSGKEKDFFIPQGSITISAF